MSHFVYHPNHEAVVVSSQEYQKYLDEGWYDTPAKFPNVNMKESISASESKIEEIPIIKKKGRPPKIIKDE